MSLIRASATIGSYTMISRILGYVRDVTIASSLGASWLSDAFFVAFKIPNFFRRLFAEGAFNSAFVPMYAGMLATDGEEKARDFAGQAMSFLIAVLTVVCIVFIAFMPWVMLGLAPGFKGDEVKFATTIELTRITFPYIFFISIVSLLGGVLNSAGRFAAVAATPIMMNLCLIVVPFFVQHFSETEAHALSIAVFVAGVVQMVWLIVACQRLDMLPSLHFPRLTPEVKRLLILIAPAAAGAGVAQINLFVDLIIASHLESGVSYLYYADRINELPLAVIGIAVGTALLPMLSKQIREGNMPAANHSQNRAIELSLLFALPSAAALMVLAEPFIRVMFERGAFSAADTALTYPALVAFAAGLPAFILTKVLSPAFYAHQDTKTPFYIAAVCIAFNLVLNLTLIHFVQHVGMALATSAAGWLNVLLMMMVLRRRNMLTLERELGLRLPRVLGACVVMSVVLLAARPAFEELLTGRFIWQVVGLMSLSALGGMAYGLAVVLLRASDMGRVKGMLRKK